MTETNVALLKQEVHYMSEKIDKIDKRLESFENKLDEFIENADNRYASKRIETFLYWMWAVVWVAVIGAMMKLILIG